MNDPRISSVDQFFEKGLLCVPSVLDAATTASFQAEIGAELSRDHGVDLAETQTWPRKRARRVFETLPVGGEGHDSHWRALRNPKGPLAQALNAVVGHDQWELNFNIAAADGARSSGGAAGVEVRHWYCPVAFPEEVPDDSHGTISEGDEKVASCSTRLSKIDYQKNALDCKGQCVSPISQLQGMPALKRSSNSVGNTHSSSHDETASSSCCPGEGPRVGELMSCAEEVALRGPLRNDSGRLAWEALARKRWQPVSRRRVLSKGWHLDVGPGFPNEGLRTLQGDPRQGVVILLLLSDCAPGCGGTALIPGSHLSVLNELEESGASSERNASSEGWSHQALNTAFVQRLRALTEAGRVQLECSACSGRHPNCRGRATHASSGKANHNEEFRERSEKANAPELLDASSSSLEKENLSVVRVIQVSGRAGDVVLMHPLLLHSGTMNCGHTPRLMANGMARVKPEAFLHRSAVAAAVATAAENSSSNDVLRIPNACAVSTSPSPCISLDSEITFPTTKSGEDYFNPIIAATLVARSGLRQKKKLEEDSDKNGNSNNNSESFSLEEADPFAGTLSVVPAARGDVTELDRGVLHHLSGTDTTMATTAASKPVATTSAAAIEKAAYKARENMRRQAAAAAREQKKRARLDRKSQGSSARFSLSTTIGGFPAAL